MSRFSLTSIGLAVALTLSTGAVWAQSESVSSGSWIAKARVIDNHYKDSSGLQFENQVSVDASVTYFFTPQLAVETGLMFPRSTDINMNGTKVGDFKPATISVAGQYHFDTGSGIRPYLGLGLHITKLRSDTAGISGVSKSGAMLQAGVDFPINNDWIFNVDVKKLYLKADNDVKLDPVVLGVGAGFKF